MPSPEVFVAFAVASRLPCTSYPRRVIPFEPRVQVTGQSLPPIQASVRAQVTPNDGSATLSADLAGARGGSLKLTTSARFERGAEVLHYDVGLSARELESFAEAAAGLDRRTTRLNLQGARLSASAHGVLSGVLRTGSDGWPEPAPPHHARNSRALVSRTSGQLNHRRRHHR